MASSSDKKIKISSFLSINAESLYERITDHTTGKVTEVNKQEPHQTTRTTIITSNPVKYETKGSPNDPKVTEGVASASIQYNAATDGYDTSQL